MKLQLSCNVILSRCMYNTGIVIKTKELDMPKGYNSLNDIPVNFYEIGLCPVCSRRLTAECEHRNEQSEVWYAAQILAEQELFTATVPDDNGLPFLALSDTVAIAVTPQLDSMLERLNKAAGYDVVTAICEKSPERKEWEAQYLAKRAAHVEKYWSK